MQKQYVTVIGAGLAGVEASYQLVKRGIPVKLYEMKKRRKVPHIKSMASLNLFVQIRFVAMIY